MLTISHYADITPLSAMLISPQSPLRQDIDALSVLCRCARRLCCAAIDATDAIARRYYALLLPLRWRAAVIMFIMIRLLLLYRQNNGRIFCAPCYFSYLFIYYAFFAASFRRCFSLTFYFLDIFMFAAGACLLMLLSPPADTMPAAATPGYC